MKTRPIAPGQMLTLLLLILLTLGTETLPERLAAAGPGAWLCPLLLGALALLPALLLARRPLPVSPLPEGAGGRLLAGAFLLWGLVLAAGHSARVAGRLSEDLRAAPALLAAAALLLAGWMAMGGLPPLARAGELFALAVGTAFVLVLLFGCFRLRWDWVLLLELSDLKAVPRGSLSAGGYLAAGSYGCFLLDQVRREEGGGLLPRFGMLFLLLALAMLLTLGRLGPSLAARVDAPFFQMVSGLGFEGAFQRLEELISALWTLGDAALLALLLLSLRRLAARLLGCPEGAALGWGLAVLVFLLSLPAALWSRLLAGELLPAGNLMAAGVLLLLLAAGQGREEKEDRESD